MFSFLNGKSPFDEAEEKLEAGETINGRPKLPREKQTLFRIFWAVLWSCPSVIWKMRSFLH